MPLIATEFLEKFHIPIWRWSKIIECQDVRSTPSTLHTAVAHGLLISSVYFWSSMLYNLLYGDIAEKTFIWTIVLMSCLVCVKYCLFRAQRDRLDEIIETVKEIEQSTSTGSASEQQLLQSRVDVMKWISMSNVFTTSFALCALCLSIYSNAEPELLFPTKLPAWVDWRNHNWMYALCILWQCLSMAYMAALTLTGDFFGPHMFILLDTFLAILDQRIRQIGWNTNTASVHLEELFKRDLILCYQLHALCLRYYVW